MNNKIKNGYSFELNGWLYVSVKGTPKERGYAYGYLIAHELEKVFEMLNFTIYETFGKTWDYFVENSTTLFSEKIKENFNEFYEEMEGIAEGCTAAGVKTSLEEIMAWNNYFTLIENWYPNKDSPVGNVQGRIRIGEGGASERCSAFIAVGDQTKDGKIVVAHNNFSEFVDGQFARVVVDMQPTNGARMLIQGFPGWIWSGTDFFVTSNGFIGTETTIGGFMPYENNFPISCRIRKAMQYGKTLDEYVEILLNENSGDYANSWLFGDINNNEILRLELGLKYHKVDRTKNGYFIGFNAPYDPRIRNLECTNTGFNDIRRHQGARRVRLEQLMREHKGKLDIELAERILADHYDVYLNKVNPCSRTCCAHYELDGREYMSDPARPKPYQPRGAIDGNVCTSDLAKNMSFILRYGNSCGIPFYKDKFCNENIQWEYLRPYLRDRPTQPWTLFSINQNIDKIQNSKIKRTLKNKKKGKKNSIKKKTYNKAEV